MTMHRAVWHGLTWGKEREAGKKPPKKGTLNWALDIERFKLQYSNTTRAHLGLWQEWDLAMSCKTFSCQKKLCPQSMQN